MKRKYGAARLIQREGGRVWRVLVGDESTPGGAEALPAEPNVYRTKKGAQDAHEAIRPTDPTLTPDSVSLPDWP